MMENSDFICQLWSMKDAFHQTSSDLNWVVLVGLDQRAGVNQRYKRRMTARSRSIFSMHHLNLEKSTKASQLVTLATLVPDFMLQSCDLSPRRINPTLVVLLFADISGFTVLTRKCVESGDDGVFKLTAIVNNFLGKMVEGVYKHGGDVFHFGGDSFLAGWKVGAEDCFGHTIHKAIRCALHIQKAHGHYKTEFKSVLKVKMGVSVGRVVWCMVGDENSRRFILTGEAVVDVKRAEENCPSGQIVVAPAIWGFVSKADFQHETMDNSEYIKVTGVFGYLGLTSNKLMKLAGAPYGHVQDAQVRPLGCLSLIEDLGSELRACTPSPVVQQVDAELPLEYLTEIRSLTVIFVSLQSDRTMLTNDFIKYVDLTYNIIKFLVKDAGGFVEKVIILDKNAEFLLVFGLREFFPEKPSFDSLNCAYDIQEALHALKGTQYVSIGIATDVTYCGVVGHERRREFTVLGPAVNKASRIVSAYPGRITCDKATQSAVRQPQSMFISAQIRVLRGYARDEEFFHFSADRSRNLYLTIQGGNAPLLDRGRELELWRRILVKGMNEESLPKGLLIIGKEGMGKSRLLDELVVEAHRLHVFPVVTGIRRGHSVIPFSAALNIIHQVLELKVCSPQLMIEILHEKLKDELSEEVLSHVEELYVEDDKFQVKIPNEYYSVSAHLKEIFCLVLQKLMKSPVLMVDDADLCDAASWELLMTAVETRCCIPLLAAEPQRSPHSLNGDLKKNIISIEIGPLPVTLVSPLICQMLKCDAIEHAVADQIRALSGGKPGLCKSSVNLLLNSGYVQLREIRGSYSLLMDKPPRHLLQISAKEVPAQTFKRFTAHELFPLRIQQVPRHHTYSPEFFYKEDMSIIRMINDQYQEAVQKDKQKYQQIADKPHEPRKDSLDSNVKRYAMIEVLERESKGQAVPKDLSSQFSINLRSMPLAESLIEESVDIFNAKSERNLPAASDIEYTKSVTSNDLQSISDIDAILEVLDDSHSQPRRGKSSIISSHSDHSHLSSDPTRYESHRSSSSLLAVVVKDKSKALSVKNRGEWPPGSLSVFDRLPPYQQLLLKCCSVIGSKFRRVMLEAILHFPDAHSFCNAIKNLFDNGVLQCAERPAIGTTNGSNTCNCLNLQDLYFSFSLPHYAFCLHMEFRDSEFRHVLYDMLPLNQKRMFHQRAAKFLATQKRKCVACQRQSLELFQLNRYSEPSVDEKAELDAFSSRLSSKMLNLMKLLMEASLPHFTDCSCIAVEMAVLKDLMVHSRAAGEDVDSIHYSLQYTRMLIDSTRHEKAKELLHELVNNEMDKVFKCPKNSRVRAEIQLQLGELELAAYNDTAMEHFVNGLIILAPMCSFARLNLKLFDSSSFCRLALKILQRRPSHLLVKFLNNITHFLMTRDRFKQARLACKTALSVLESIEDPIEKCIAKANLVDITISLNRSLTDLDKHDLMAHLANGLIPAKNLQEAVALARILHAIYVFRLIEEGDLQLALELLRGLERVSQCIPTQRVHELLNLEKVHLLMMVGELRGAAMAVLPLRGGSSTHQMWFHSINLDFCRFSGHWIAPPCESVAFIVETLGQSTGPCYQRGAASLLLWHLYTGSPMPETRTKGELSGPVHVRCVIDLWTRCHRLEAFAINHSIQPLNLRNTSHLTHLSEFRSNIGLLAHLLPVFAPMYNYLMALVEVKFDRNWIRGEEYLNEASAAAEQQGNQLLLIIISASRQTWRNGTRKNRALQISALPDWVNWRRSSWTDTILKPHF